MWIITTRSDAAIPSPETKRFESGQPSNPNNKKTEPTKQETFYPLADTTVIQGYPSNNYSGFSSMLAGYDHDNADPPYRITRSLIFFYISSLPANQNIIEATLRLYHTGTVDTSGTSRIYTTHRIISNWAESTVTWNNAPDFGEAYGSQSIIGLGGAWYDFDVTNLVRNWDDGTYENYGIMLRGPEFYDVNSSLRIFGTSLSSHVPELVIQYEPKVPPPTGNRIYLPVLQKSQ
jgi:hypothetical protein